MWTVYKHTCPNGKIYIGITSQKPTTRWNKGNGYRKNEYFWKAIKKYGWGNIKHEILFELLTKEEACKKEIELIAKYKSNVREFGYNASTGGDISALGYHHTDEAKQRISEAFKGKHLSAKHREKLSEAHKGKQSPNKGKIFSVETRKKLSDSHKGKQSARKGAVLTIEQREKISRANKGKPSMHRKKVECIETGVIYVSIHEAATANGIDFRNLSAACNGIQKSCGGYHWRFADV